MVAVLPVVPLAVIGLLAVIAYETGVTLQSMYVRDAAVKTKESDVNVQQSQDQTVNDILNNASLTPEQKLTSLKTYLDLQDKKEEDTLADILPWILGTAIVILTIFILNQQKR